MANKLLSRGVTSSRQAGASMCCLKVCVGVGCLSVSLLQVTGRPKSFSRLSQSLVSTTSRHFRLCLVMGGGVAGCEF